MDKRSVLALVVVGAAGWAVFQHRDEIIEKLGFGDVSPESMRAIEIAKSGYDLDSFRENHAAIGERVAQASADGAVARLGWEAERVDRGGSVFLVKFRYTVDGTERGFWFEVDVAELRSQVVNGDTRLEQRYGKPLR